LLGVLILAVSVWDTEAISGPFEEIGVGLVLTDLAAVGCILASAIAPTMRALSRLMAGTIRRPISLVVGSCRGPDYSSGG
jgi:hypothetical protein